MFSHFPPRLPFSLLLLMMRNDEFDFLTETLRRIINLCDSLIHIFSACNQLEFSEFTLFCTYPCVCVCVVHISIFE